MGGRLWILATVVEQAVACLFIVSRYSVGAYAVRTFSVIVSTIVLSAMLSEFVRVYASLVRTNQMLQRERESKLTTVAAAVAAIAHEIKTTADRYKRQQLGSTTFSRARAGRY